MQKFHRVPSLIEHGYPVLGTASTSVSVADGVYIDGNGYLTIVTTSSKVAGFSNETKTFAATNATVELYKSQWIPWLGVLMVYGSDQDCTQTDVGAYADFVTITSGSQALNLLAGTSGQFLVLGFDPDGESDNDAVVVEVAEPQQLAFAQA